LINVNIWASLNLKEFCINHFTDSIECSFDICHLAWLLGDTVTRSHLLPFIMAGWCKNGTKFEDLDPNGFNHCVVRGKITDFIYFLTVFCIKQLI
jgi:hypothetical protein